jgi:hypothetical protein
MNLTKRIVRWTLLVSLFATFTGCGDSLLGPAPVDMSGGSGSGGGTPQSGPQVLVVHADGSVGWTEPPPAWMPHQTGLLPDLIDGVRAQLTERVDGLLGSKMRCGRFFLTVPPGAFLGLGTITMTTVDSTVMICDLEIHPDNLNAFRAPVRISMCTNGADVDPDSLTMYWYNTETKKWVDIGADKHPSDVAECTGGPYPPNMVGIVSSLSHFSRYAGGKAGW